MARYPAHHKGMTRTRILGAASRVFRERGFAGGGIGEVMGAASLTKGGFYAHFESKDELFRAAFDYALQRQRRLFAEILGPLEGDRRVERTLAVYLDPQHLGRDATACPLPCLLSELRRSDADVRAVLELHHRWVVQTIAEHLAKAGRSDSAAQCLASSLVSLAVGAITIARACEVRQHAEQILSDALTTCRHLLDGSPPERNNRCRSDRPATAETSRFASEADGEPLAPPCPPSQTVLERPTSHQLEPSEAFDRRQETAEPHLLEPAIH